MNHWTGSPKSREKNLKISKAEGEISMDTAVIQKNIREYYRELYAPKIDNLEEMGKFLDTYIHKTES